MSFSRSITVTCVAVVQNISRDSWSMRALIVLMSLVLIAGCTKSELGPISGAYQSLSFARLAKTTMYTATGSITDSTLISAYLRRRGVGGFLLSQDSVPAP